MMASGIAASVSSTKASSAVVSTARVCSAKTIAFVLPPVASIPTKIGTNAAEKAPSANSERNRFGKRNATKKASATGPAPSSAASSISRTKPRTRLTAVSPPIVAIERKSDM